MDRSVRRRRCGLSLPLLHRLLHFFNSYFLFYEQMYHDQNDVYERVFHVLSITIVNVTAVLRTSALLFSRPHDRRLHNYMRY